VGNAVNDAGGNFRSAPGIFIGRLRIAFRGLWNNPLITVSAIISIALGIGASTAMFSIYDEVLLRRLPVPEPERLVNFSSPGPKPGNATAKTPGGIDDVFSYPMFRDLEKIPGIFTGVAAHVPFNANIAAPSGTSNEPILFVSGSYFPVLGIHPALGRLLNTNDDKTIGEGRVAVLSYDYWRNNFGGDENALNQSILVNGQYLTVVGVAPRGFTGTTLGLKPRIFVPVTMHGPLLAGEINPDYRQYYCLYLFGRLAPGVTLEQARVGINITYHNIINQVEAPEAERLMIGEYASFVDMFRAKQLVLKPGARGQSNYSSGGDIKTLLNIFMGSTLLLLLIACANITNLLVARGLARSGEMAVRFSMGATRIQIFTQLLTESFILVIIAGIAGMIAAQWILRFIVALIPAQYAADFSFTLNGKILIFAVIMTVATGIAVGMFPAIYGARPDLSSMLKEQAGQVKGSKTASRLRTALIAAQIALSLTLLTVSGLFAKSLYNINRIDHGMKLDHVVTFGVSPALNGYTHQQSAQFFGRLEDELAALPGVKTVTNSQIKLLSGNYMGNNFVVEGHPPDRPSNEAFNVAGPAYFQTLGVPLIAGRDFTREDTAAAGRPKVAVVNEAFAEKYNLGRDAVGKRIGIFDIGGTALDIEIIGLAKNAKYQDVMGEWLPQVIMPNSRYNSANRIFYVQTAQPPETLLPRIRGLAARLDHALPVENLSTMPRHVHDQTFPHRLSSTLAAAFACLATLLTAVGLYGIFAYNVARRRREIGLRMALGATRLRLCLMFLRQAALIALTGCAPGFVLSVFAGRVIQSQLYKLEGFDAAVFLGAPALLFVIITQVVLIPVRRAVTAEPMDAMRDES